MEFRYIIVSILSFFVYSCAGYKLGTTKPKPLENVELLAVTIFENSTSEPRAEALLTTMITQAIARDGTYKISNSSNADGILEGRLESIKYTTLRSSRFDTLLSEELNNEVTISWSVKNAKNPTKTIASGVTSGRSTFFADSNLQTARKNALSDAFERTSSNLISQLTTGY